MPYSPSSACRQCGAPAAYFAEDRGLEGGILSVLAVLQIVPYYLMGFETIPKCSEEAASDVVARRFVWIMLGALGVARDAD